jgi:hypothetical protein
MAQRIEEAFKSVAPKGRSGQVSGGSIDAAVGGSTLSPALAEAAGEIAKLREVYQRQVDLIAANTQALAQSGGGSGSSVAGKVAGTASQALSGGLGLLSPVISGLLGLFGHHASTPAPLPVYTPPTPVSIDATLRSASASQPASPVAAAPVTTAQQPAWSPQITVNVSAMDSRSFMDRSSDIASAVREAMLNNHPINGVISDL